MTPPQSEERPITHTFMGVTEVCEICNKTKLVEPSHPDTLRKVIEDGLDKCFHWGDDDRRNEFHDEEASGFVLSLVAQEKERWESELREKVEGLMLRVAGFDSVREDEVYNAALSNVLALISNKGKE